MYWYLFLYINIIVALKPQKYYSSKIVTPRITTNKISNVNWCKKDNLRYMYFGHDNYLKKSKIKIANCEVGKAMIMAYFKDMYKVNNIRLNKQLSMVRGEIDYEELFKATDYSRDIMKKQLIVKMAPQAAMNIYYGKSMQAIEMSEDFKEAKKIAESMIKNNNATIKTDICLDLYYNEYKESLKLFEDNMKKRLDYFTTLIVNDAYSEALHLLLFFKEKMNILTNELINKNEINHDFLYIYTEIDKVKSDLDREC